MCGISGIRRYGDIPIDPISIQLLLTGMEHRGNDATGIVLQQKDGEIVLCKDNVPAWLFVTGKMYEEFLNEHLNDGTVSVLLHTRAATTGNPIKPENNHPMFYDKCAVIHNGMISNDDTLFRTLELERRAETDSDILRAIVDKWGITKEGVNKLNLVSGSAAIAVVSPDEPGKLLLARSGSPISIGSTPEMFVFASEKNIIHRAMRPWIKRFGIDFQVQSLQMAFSPFPDDTAWLLGPNGLEWHQRFDTLIGQYKTPGYERTYTDYSNRQDKWKADAEWEERRKDAKPIQQGKKLADGSIVVQSEPLHPEALQCPKCHLALKLNDEQRRGSLYKLTCPKDSKGCGANLGEALAAAKVAKAIEVVNVN